MEQQNKYYTPEWNELRLGDTIECWHSYDNPTFEHDIFNGWEIDTLKKYLADGALRVKYLDQSDIESCGWEKVEESTNQYGIVEIRGRIDKKYDGIEWAEPMGMFWNICCAPVQRNNSISKIAITETEWGGFAGSITTVDVYKGECKSINELRKIMQWLNIK